MDEQQRIAKISVVLRSIGISEGQLRNIWSQTVCWRTDGEQRLNLLEQRENPPEQRTGIYPSLNNIEEENRNITKEVQSDTFHHNTSADKLMIKRLQNELLRIKSESSEKEKKLSEENSILKESYRRCMAEFEKEKELKETLQACLKASEEKKKQAGRINDYGQNSQRETPQNQTK